MGSGSETRRKSFNAGPLSGNPIVNRPSNGNESRSGASGGGFRRPAPIGLGVDAREAARMGRVGGSSSLGGASNVNSKANGGSGGSSNSNANGNGNMNGGGGGGNGNGDRAEGSRSGAGSNTNSNNNSNSNSNGNSNGGQGQGQRSNPGGSGSGSGEGAAGFNPNRKPTCDICRKRKVSRRRGASFRVVFLPSSSCVK
jgi:hypothetical protein